MEFDFRAFAFIITLAAVINGLGIVRLLTAFADYLRNQGRIQIKQYWVFSLWMPFQFLIHILLWWSLWNTQEADSFNFISYLYVLTGPIVLYLGTSLLVPDSMDGGLDLREHYFRVRRPYFTLAAILWLWAVFFWPVLKGVWAPTVPLFACYLGLVAILRFTANPKIHAALAIAAWLLLVIFVAMFALRLGGVAASL